MAGAIPDPGLRADALRAIDGKRGHIDGAAFFWSLASCRSRSLLRTLVALELVYDYLDELSERGVAAGLRNGRQLGRSFADAVAPDRPPDDYYRFHLAADDGGFMHALVRTCQRGCRELPAFDVVAPLIAEQTARLEVLALNHLPDPAQRDGALRAWAAREFAGERHGLEWWELTAASSQSVVTFALLALAADPHATPEQAEAVHAAYFPWFALGVTMLDAYVDQEEDVRSGAHSYVGHYPSREASVARLCETVERAAAAQLSLPHGERHTVLLACMVAMYLSKDSARAPALREGTARIVAAGGSLTRLLLPVLRLWRIVNGQTRLT
jgi:tetraprenyl-beta-curcumene synthase